MAPPGRMLGRPMDYSHLGSILALVGMVLLLTVNLNRRAARQRKMWTKTDVLLQKWGGLERMP